MRGPPYGGGGGGGGSGKLNAEKVFPLCGKREISGKFLGPVGPRKFLEFQSLSDAFSFKRESFPG